MDTVEFLREKGMLLEGKETFKITYEDGTEVVLNDLLEEYANQSVLRQAAEFDNYKKRVIKEKQEISNRVKYETLSSFLDILDDFELAKSNISNSKDVFLHKGLDLIFKKIDNYLKSQNIEEIDTSGKFDSNLHEAITMVNMDKESGDIIETIKKGYMIDGKIVRYPKVVVNE